MLSHSRLHLFVGEAIIPVSQEESLQLMYRISKRTRFVKLSRLKTRCRVAYVLSFVDTMHVFDAWDGEHTTPVARLT